MAQNLQERKNAFKRNLAIFNSGKNCGISLGNTFNSKEMQEIFELVDSLDETKFNALNHITILTDNDAYEVGYNNGAYEAERRLKG